MFGQWSPAQRRKAGEGCELTGIGLAGDALARGLTQCSCQSSRGYSAMADGLLGDSERLQRRWRLVVANAAAR